MAKGQVVMGSRAVVFCKVGHINETPTSADLAATHSHYSWKCEFVHHPLALHKPALKSPVLF